MSDYLYAVIGISLIFICTTIGAFSVFFFKKEISNTLNKIFIGFAAGVMLSASFFSLIKPALETEGASIPTWLIVGISIILGRTGNSKTLSFKILFNSLKGEYSESSFLRSKGI